MRVAVVGPGAIGCVAAAALASRDDHDLLIAARTPFSELAVDLPDGTELRSTPRVVTSAQGLDHVDLVVFATKAHQTEPAKPWLDALCGPGTVVAALQNGVEHHERLVPLIGEASLAPAIVFCPAHRDDPGRVTVGGRAMITVPDDAPGAVVVEAFADTLLQVKQTDDWLSLAWIKLLSNCAGGGITTLARTSNRAMHDEDAARLCLDLMHEVVRVGRAEGAVLDDDIADRALAGILKNAGDHHSSIVVDRLAGRATEWRVRNEVVVRLAGKHGIDVPLNRAVTTLLRLGEPSAD